MAITDIQTQTNKGAEIITITRSTNSTTSLPEPDLTNCILFEKQEQGDTTTEIYIKHPYLSDKFTVTYINDKEFYNYGKDLYAYADATLGQITATLYEKGGEIISYSGNGGPVYHKQNGCERKRLNMPTGQGYDLCDGCNPKNHSEPSAIKRANTQNKYSLLKGANAYLYGHWWSCKDCSETMEQAGIKQLFISKDWTREFLGIE